jgi:hypothetical protein
LRKAISDWIVAERLAVPATETCTGYFDLRNGGHDRDRTCDPYHVKVVLSR